MVVASPKSTGARSVSSLFTWVLFFSAACLKMKPLCKRCHRGDMDGLAL